MTRYRKYNWPELFNRFEASNLSQTDFCKQNDINPKYFSQKRAAFKAKTPAESSFIAAEIAAPTTLVSEAHITLTVGRCTVQCPTVLPLSSIADLVKQLT